MNLTEQAPRRRLAFILLVAMGTVVYSMALSSMCTSDSTSSGRVDYPAINYSVPKLHHCPFKTRSDGTVMKTVPKLIRRVFPLSSCEDAVVSGIPICRFPDCGVNPCRQGWCEETMDGYTCHCPREFTGPKCEYAMVPSPELSSKSTLEGSRQPLTIEQSVTSLDISSPPTNKWTPPSLEKTVGPLTSKVELPTEGHTSQLMTTKQESTEKPIGIAMFNMTPLLSQETTTDPPTMSTASDGSTPSQTSKALSTPHRSSSLMTTQGPTTTVLSAGVSGTETVEVTNTVHVAGETTQKPQPPSANPERKTSSSGTPIIFGLDECSDDIYISDLTTSSFIVLETRVSGFWPEDIAFDSVDKKIYLLSTGLTDEICSETLEGQDYMCWEITVDCRDPSEIDIDMVGRKLYCSCDKKVISMNLDGTAMQTDFTHNGAREIEHLAVTNTAKFWATEKKIYRTDSLGTDTLYAAAANNEICGLSLDFVGSHVFFVVDLLNGNYNIMQMEFNGENQSISGTWSEGYIEDFMVFQGEIYLSSNGDVYEINRGVVSDHLGCPFISEIYIGNN